MRVVVVGAGASGLICAGRLGERGFEVKLIDSNEKVGKKIYITGKGRCNLTNSGENFFDSVVSNPKFLFSSFSKFSNYDCIDFFNTLGLQTKIERGDRVFPVSDKSSDVIKVLEKYCKNNGVQIILNEKVKSIKKYDDGNFILKTNSKVLECDKVVIATGGRSYSLTGSTGSGYDFAREFGHSINTLKPALVPIILKDKYCAQIEGLPLKNVKLIAYSDNKFYKELFGELMFTNNGITGPIVLSMSSYINRLSNIELFIDFKPALTTEMILARLEREIEESPKISLSSLMRKYLPKNFVSIFINYVNISESKKILTLNEKERKIIADSLKLFKLSYDSLCDIDKAIITSGGVSTNEINPKNFESKIVKDLYFIGEVLDVDALTGGYNLQIAWTSGYVCADLMEER